MSAAPPASSSAATPAEGPGAARTSTAVLQGLAWLLVAQSLGEVIAQLTGAPLPGPVIGLLLMLVALRWRALREPVAQAAEGLLAHLSLLFVPVGVGVMTHVALLLEHGVRMLIVVVVSTWVALAVTAWLMRACMPASTDLRTHEKA